MRAVRGPASAMPWMILPSASSPGFRRPSTSSTSRQLARNCPSWLRGVSRTMPLTNRAAGSNRKLTSWRIRRRMVPARLDLLLLVEEILFADDLAETGIVFDESGDEFVQAA